MKERVIWSAKVWRKGDLEMIFQEEGNPEEEI
jgi:hypothetical protein